MFSGKNLPQQLNSISLKAITIAFSLLFGLIGWFVNNKLTEIEQKLDKIEQIEDKVQTLTKSQIQIMTHLNIPIPDYLFSSAYCNPIMMNRQNFPKNNQILIYNQSMVLPDNRQRFLKQKKQIKYET
jgi:hypothetical protein